MKDKHYIVCYLHYVLLFSFNPLGFVSLSLISKVSFYQRSGERERDRGREREREKGYVTCMHAIDVSSV